MVQNEDKILLKRVNNMAIAWCINSLAYSIVYPFIPLYLHNNRQAHRAMEPVVVFRTRCNDRICHYKCDSKTSLEELRLHWAATSVAF